MPRDTPRTQVISERSHRSPRDTHPHWTHGFSAAGKSTLADELAVILRHQGRTCLRVDLDDFKRPELRGCWDFRIFVEIDFDLVLARGAARDSAWVGSAQAAAEQYRRYYIPAERLYDAEADPRSHADVIVDNRNLGRPVLRQGWH